MHTQMSFERTFALRSQSHFISTPYISLSKLPPEQSALTWTSLQRREVPRLELLVHSGSGKWTLVLVPYLMFTHNEKLPTLPLTLGALAKDFTLLIHFFPYAFIQEKVYPDEFPFPMYYNLSLK